MSYISIERDPFCCLRDKIDRKQGKITLQLFGFQNKVNIWTFDYGGAQCAAVR